ARGAPLAGRSAPRRARPTAGRARTARRARGRPAAAARRTSPATSRARRPRRPLLRLPTAPSCPACAPPWPLGVAPTLVDRPAPQAEPLQREQRDGAHDRCVGPEPRPGVRAGDAAPEEEGEQGSGTSRGGSAAAPSVTSARPAQAQAITSASDAPEPTPLDPA